MEKTRVIRIPKRAKSRIDPVRALAVFAECYRQRTGREPAPVTVRETKNYTIITVHPQPRKKKGVGSSNDKEM